MSIATGFEHCLCAEAPLSGRTWLGVGGPAEFFAEPETQEDLIALVSRCRTEGVAARVLGGGSNVLVRDEGVRGVVISLAAPCFTAVRVGGGVVTAGGGASLAGVINEAVRHGLAGLDALVGVPGTIGGALHGNSGTRGGDIGQWVAAAAVLTRDGQVLNRTREDLVFAYRQSSLDELAILSAEFRLEQDDPEKITKHMQKQWIVKRASQPLSDQRTGQVFKNPRGMSAGMLIEQAGLKGASVGGAAVSTDHGNFFVTARDATAADVLKLIDLVRSRVAERLGVELETSIEVW